MCLTILAVCLLLQFPAIAVADQYDGDWHFSLLFPMIWAPDIKGDIQVGSDKYSVKIPFDEKIKDLDTGLIGEFYVHKGPWVGGVKLNYMRSRTEENTAGIKIPGGPSLISPHRISTKIEEGTFDLILGYKVLDRLLIYGGARQFGQKFVVSLEPLQDDGLGFDTRLTLVDENYWDAVLGLSWTNQFSEHWSLALSGDFNVAGDSEQNLFLEARVGFKISQLNNLWFGYRGSQIKLIPDTDGELIVTDFRQHGLTVGWAFTF